LYVKYVLWSKETPKCLYISCRMYTKEAPRRASSCSDWGHSNSKAFFHFVTPSSTSLCSMVHMPVKGKLHVRSHAEVSPRPTHPYSLSCSRLTDLWLLRPIAGDATRGAFDRAARLLGGLHATLYRTLDAFPLRAKFAS
jgi:hypothetical protein